MPGVDILKRQPTKFTKSQDVHLAFAGMHFYEYE
jgi:hypothetical protein